MSETRVITKKVYCFRSEYLQEISKLALKYKKYCWTIVSPIDITRAAQRCCCSLLDTIYSANENCHF